LELKIEADSDSVVDYPHDDMPTTGVHCVPFCGHFCVLFCNLHCCRIFFQFVTSLIDKNVQQLVEKVSQKFVIEEFV